MTEANPEGSSTPEQEPTGANKPSAPAQESATSKPDGFNWLALAGIVATVIAAVTGSWFTYQTSADKIHADAKSATIDQRKTAYLDFLTAEADEWDESQRLSHKFAAFAAGGVQYGDLVNSWNKWSATLNPQNRTQSEVKLVASPSIYLMVDTWIAYDNSVLHLMGKIKDATDAACGVAASPTSTTCGKVPSVANQVPGLEGAVATESEPQIHTFVDVAQVDLGLSPNSVCGPTQDPHKAKATVPWQVSWSCT
jgi:hypothetical protein